MIVTDLSNSFNPYPKNKTEKKKPTKTIKKKSNKLAKKEKDRFSILQKDKTKCFLCSKCLKLDTHEAFGGSNRQKSMQWGLVYYLCRICHQKADTEKQIRQYLHDYAKRMFIKKYNEEEFLKEFGKNYLQEKRNANNKRTLSDKNRR